MGFRHLSHIQNTSLQQVLWKLSIGTMFKFKFPHSPGISNLLKARLYGLNGALENMADNYISATPQGPCGWFNPLESITVYILITVCRL